MADKCVLISKKHHVGFQQDGKVAIKVTEGVALLCRSKVKINPSILVIANKMPKDRNYGATRSC